MSAIDIALPRVKAAEGFRSAKYTDTRGYLTIGYGFNVDAGISERAASALCEAQLEEALADCDGQPWFPSGDDVRASVFVELVFNMGLGKLLGFKLMLAAAQAHQWDEAANQLQNSAWFSQVGHRGPLLVRLLANGG